jgi:glycosyltransferase involved in cell wall biosynthesis
LAARRALSVSGGRDAPHQIIHAQGVYQAPAAERVAQTFDIPFTITLRDDLGHLRTPSASGQLYYNLLWRAAAVFAVGPAQIRDLKLLIPSESHHRLHLAPNGVEVSKLREALAQVPFTPRRREDPVSIVSVSSLHRFKGIHENIAALQRLHAEGMVHWSYTIIGDGPYRAELENLVRKSGLSKKIEFKGSVEHSEALRRIRNAEIFCLPSWMEPFGNVYAEAAVCGVPAIGCIGQGPELIIQNGETGLLVPPRDIDSLATAIARLITQPELAKRMGKEAERNITRLSWNRTARLYARVFSALVAQPPDQNKHR